MDMIDAFMTFRDLAEHMQEGVDFRIRTQRVDSPILIMAIHGGNIEPMASELATSIAGSEFDLYLFEGLRDAENELLHIDENYFDEPQAQEMVSRTGIVVSVRGHQDAEHEFVMIGGMHKEMISEMAKRLTNIGIEVYAYDRPDDTRNVCNRGLLGKGIELIVSKKLRDALQDDAGLHRLLIQTIRRAIAITYNG